MVDPLQTDITYLKGIGPKLAPSLHKLGLRTVRDVLNYEPRRYEDRRNLPKIGDVRAGQAVTVRGKVIAFSDRPVRGGRVLVKVTIADETGFLDLTFFNQPWLKKSLGNYDGEVVAFGAVKGGFDGLEIAGPEWEKLEDDDETDGFARLTPVYPLKESVPQWLVRRAAASAVEYFAPQVTDPLPDEFRRAQKVQRLAWSLRQIHHPESEEFRRKGHQRLVFDEFLGLQLRLCQQRSQLGHELGVAYPILDRLPELRAEVSSMLPFTLTNAQERVIGEIWSDMARPSPMNRLVQGDVGSGKTAVAAAAMLAVVRAGYQAALMAPTEILAEQHAVGLRRLMGPLGIPVELLVGKLPVALKRGVKTRLAKGQPGVVVGTHALITEDTEIPKLGFVVIDEQHRFGVMQRKALRDKASVFPDVLVMTATPIPRTLTMAVFGDLDLSVIDELPPGRTPIRTFWKPRSERDAVYRGARKFVEEGRQIYVVCPMIGDNEKVNAQAAEEVFGRLSTGIYADYTVELLHGQMKPIDKEMVMERFRMGQTQVLVSTTVIEVGVDVPNATVMIIEDADRFGLAQLHQLRGRVGRGSYQSHCVLVSDPASEDGRKRMEIMVETTDGFRIADEDLKLRGPGAVAGTAQSGHDDFRFADLATDGLILAQAQAAAREIIAEDPELSSAKWSPLRALMTGARLETEIAKVA